MAFGVSPDVNFYRMLFQTVCKAEANVIAASNLRMWHERLGHVSLKLLLEMNKQGLLNLGRISKDTKLFCDQMGKQHRRPFKNTESRDIMLEKFIYTDVGSCRTSQ